MKSRTWTIIVAISVVAILIWLLWNRESTEWSNDVPHHIRGKWNLVEDFSSENYGIRSIHLSRDVIVLDIALDAKEAETSTFPIRRVSSTGRKGTETGALVIFYGPADDNTIAKNRLKIYFGPQQKINVQKIVPTGLGDDRWFDIGEFVKVE